MRIILNILHAVSIGTIILAIGVYLFGSAFNDSVNKQQWQQWQNILNIALLSTLIIVALTFLLVVWRPGFLQSVRLLQQDGIRVIIALFGAVLAVVVALSPFIITLPKLDRNAKNVNQQEAEQRGNELSATTQEYVRLKKPFTGAEVKDYLVRADTMLTNDKIGTGLTGWQQLLEAKVIDPNIKIETKFYPRQRGINDDITEMWPILNYALSYSDKGFGEALLQYGADPNATGNVEDNTAFIQSAIRLAWHAKFYVSSHDAAGLEAQFEKTNLVLSCGADVTLKNKSGKTALDILVEQRAQTVLKANSSKTDAGILKPVLDTLDREIETIQATRNNSGIPGSCKKSSVDTL